MNVYDFDGTVYRGDSTVDFYFFELVRHPAILFDIPAQLAAFFKYKTEKIDKTEFKQCFYRFLHRISDINSEVNRFWDKKQHKINKWYHDLRRPDDVIISASPAFLLSEICARLSVGCLIASQVDPESGKHKGGNCRGQEKVRRFCEVYPDISVMDDFYSDSLSDEPMAKLAKRAFFVSRSGIRPWEFNSGKDC